MFYYHKKTAHFIFYWLRISLKSITERPVKHAKLYSWKDVIKSNSLPLVTIRNTAKRKTQHNTQAVATHPTSDLTKTTKHNIDISYKRSDTESRLKQHVLCLSFFLLAPGLIFASINPAFTPSTHQKTNIHYFHETTELADLIWIDLTNRFITLYEKGDYQNSLGFAQRAYHIADKNFGLNSVNTADALLKLGIINQTLGNLNRAEDHLLKALIILEMKLYPLHPDLAVIMTNLGNVYFELQRPETSEKYHLQALTIRKNAFGKNDPAVAQSTYNLAVLYENQYQYEQAEIFYQQAINLWSVSMSPTHPYIGNALNNLSNLYNVQGKYKKATGVLQRILVFKKSVFGHQHGEVAATLINLGTNYLEQGEYSPASHAYEEALNIAQHVLGSSNPQLALLMYTLANIYHTQARTEEQNQASSKTGIMPVNNSSTGLENIAQRKTVLFAQALPLYKKAAEILDDGENEMQSALDIVLTELAILYKEIGDTDMAQAIESRIRAH